MKKLALFAVLCVSVIGFSVGCSGDTATDTPAAPATEGNGDAAAPAATEGSDTTETPAAPAE